MKITTFQRQLIDVDTDPERCKKICGFKPDDIVTNNDCIFRIAGIGRGVDDKNFKMHESNKMVAWGWLFDINGHKKTRVMYFYTTKFDSNLEKMGFRFVKTFKEYMDDDCHL